MDVDGVAGIPVQFLVHMVLVCGKILVGDDLFSCYILYDIGDGLRVKSWQDCWCGETPLAVRFPDLFRFC